MEYRKTKGEILGQDKSKVVLCNEVNWLESPERTWLGREQPDILLQGKCALGDVEAIFVALQFRDGRMELLWGSAQGGTLIGEARLNFSDLVLDEEDDIWAGFSDGHAGIKQIFNGIDPAEQGEIKDLLKILAVMDRWAKSQAFYKEALTIGSAWRLVQIDRQKAEADVVFDKFAKASGLGAVIKHPSREIREWAIKRIGRQGKIGR